MDFFGPWSSIIYVFEKPLYAGTLTEKYYSLYHKIAVLRALLSFFTFVASGVDLFVCGNFFQLIFTQLPHILENWN